MNKSRWKKSEDHILEAGIMKYGIHKWHKISSLLGRPPSECKKRWFEFLSPDARKNWDEESIAELKRLAKVFSNQWELIGRKLGRTGQECYEKYGEIVSGYRGYRAVEHRDNTGDVDVESANLVKARLLNTKSRKVLRKESIAAKKELIYNLNVKKRAELGVSANLNAEDVLRNVKCFDKNYTCDGSSNEMDQKNIIGSKSTDEIENGRYKEIKDIFGSNKSKNEYSSKLMEIKKKFEEIIKKGMMKDE